MGYGGKWQERERARELRAQAWTLQEIADELGVAKGSVSVWVRDVEFTPRPRNRGTANQRPHPLHLAKLAELERCRDEAAAFVGNLSDRELALVGAALYLGEGAKTERSAVRLANTSPDVMTLFMLWLRRCFEIDESRLRARLYLHEGLDEVAAMSFWSRHLDIPVEQFQATQWVRPTGHRASKHQRGCVTVVYSSLPAHRRVMAMVEALASSVADPG